MIDAEVEVLGVHPLSGVEASDLVPRRLRGSLPLRKLKAHRDQGQVLPQVVVEGARLLEAFSCQGPVEVPQGWSQVASDILAQKYFRKRGVPRHLTRVEEEGVPAFLWRSQPDEKALAQLPVEERLTLVAELMTSKGYMVEAEATTSHTGGVVGSLRIHNCAIREIAERFPEACVVEARMMERMVGAPLERGAHRLHGCVRCEYNVRSGHLSKWNTEQA